MNRIYLFVICLVISSCLNCYAQWAKVDGLYYNETDGGVKLTYVSVDYCMELKNKGTITIPDSVTKGNQIRPVVAIGEDAFQSCKNKSFKLQGGRLIERVEQRAFKGCSKMTGFIETESLSYLGFEAFRGCGLSSVKIKPAYHDLTIGKYAFYGSGITNLEIGYRVKEISGHAFDSCWKMISVKFENGSLLTNIGDYAFYDCQALSSFSIPDKVTSVGELAFGSNDYSTGMYLNSVTVGMSVKTIGPNAFYKCNRLATVNWNVKRMDITQTSVDVFNNLESINTFTFGNKVEDIPAHLCKGCKGITSITIPEKVSSIGSKAFSDCRGLKEVIWKAERCGGTTAFDGLPNITSFVFHDGVTTIPSRLCQNLTGLTQVQLPESAGTIGRSAFQGCRNLKSVSLCVEGMSVGVDAFEGCSSISSIHNSYKRIEYGYWYYCTDDTDINSYGHSGQFDDAIFKTCKLYVPNGLLEEYKKSFLWHHFVNMAEETSDIEEIEFDKFDVIEIERYDIAGHRLYAPQTGVNIVRYSDGSIRKELVP